MGRLGHMLEEVSISVSKQLAEACLHNVSSSRVDPAIGDIGSFMFVFFHLHLELQIAGFPHAFVHAFV